jgi:hypothetical protein
LTALTSDGKTIATTSSLGIGAGLKDKKGKGKAELTIRLHDVATGKELPWLTWEVMDALQIIEPCPQGVRIGFFARGPTAGIS